MAKNNYFQFKQFTVWQEKAAMKVGTDGILLGAWAKVEKCTRILDVGTGTGLIALMLAQRSYAAILAIEIEKNAAEEARHNVFQSPWDKRVEVQNVSFQEFAENNPVRFDLVVSNPPYFSNALKPGYKERTLARHNDSLTFSELIIRANGLLKGEGRLAVVLPAESLAEFELLANNNNMFLCRKTIVHPKMTKPPNRVLLELGKKQAVPVTDSLPIYNENGDWSESFKKLTRDYYLSI